VNLLRIARHAFQTWIGGRRRFPKHTLDRLDAAIEESEKRDGGELRFVVETGLEGMRLWRGITPRARAEEVFARLGVWDTELDNGVLIYVLLADRDVEILADRGYNGKVTTEEWEAVCREVEGHFARGDFEAGSLAGIAGVTRLMERHFPPGSAEPNELPNRPVLM
jgi:uncharacterized membrane protein YgcG